MQFFGAANTGGNVTPIRANLASEWIGDTEVANGHADGDAIQTWHDTSGNSHDATQATPDQRPILKTAVINGHAVMRGDGTKYMSGSGFTVKNGCSIFVVSQCVSASVLNTFFSKQTNDLTVIQYDTGGIALAKSGVQFIADEGVLGSTAVQLAEYTYNGTTGKVYRNGSLLGSGAFASSGLTDNATFLIGADVAAEEVDAGIINGDIAEILIYSVALSDADRQAVEAYLILKYGIFNTYVRQSKFTYIRPGGGFYQRP